MFTWRGLDVTSYVVCTHVPSTPRPDQIVRWLNEFMEYVPIGVLVQTDCCNNTKRDFGSIIAQKFLKHQCMCDTCIGAHMGAFYGAVTHHLRGVVLGDMRKVDGESSIFSPGVETYVPALACAHCKGVFCDLCDQWGVSARQTCAACDLNDIRERGPCPDTYALMTSEMRARFKLWLLIRVRYQHTRWKEIHYSIWLHIGTLSL